MWTFPCLYFKYFVYFVFKKKKKKNIYINNHFHFFYKFSCNKFQKGNADYTQEFFLEFHCQRLEVYIIYICVIIT